MSYKYLIYRQFGGNTMLWSDEMAGVRAIEPYP